MNKVMEIDASFEDKKTVLIDATLSDGGTPVMSSSMATGVNLGGSRDYRKLKNKPTINGTELYDNYDEIDPTVPEWAKTPNKPEYDSDEIGAVSQDDKITEPEIDAIIAAVFGLV